MRYLRYAALLGICLFFASFASAQRVVVGVGVGPGYYGAAYVGPPPDCTYGYYNYYPYACAPYGYYGPQWFVNGIFIGVGPWYHWYWRHPGWYGRGFYGRGWHGDWDHDGWRGRGFRGDWGHDGWRGHEFHGDRGWGHEGFRGRGFDHEGFGHGGGFHSGDGFRGGGGFHGGGHGRGHGGHR